MQSARRLAILAATLVAAGAAAGPAHADTPAFCPSLEPQPPDGSVLFGNEANGAGCVVVRLGGDGTLALEQIVLAPGWSGRIKSAGGADADNRVRVRFTEFATGRVVRVRIEPGRTVVKG